MDSLGFRNVPPEIIKQIINYVAPDEKTISDSYFLQVIWKGLHTTSCVSHFFYKNTEEVKIQWLQEQLPPLAILPLPTAEMAIKFIEDNQLKKINVAPHRNSTIPSFKRFEDSHLKTLFDKQLQILRLKIDCRFITKWPLMESLLHFSPLNVSNYQLVSFASKSPNLRTIDLSCLDKRDKVKDTGIEILAKNCTQLEEINLSYTRVSDDGIKKLAQYCNNLQVINLYCTSVSDTGLIELANGCHQLKSLNLFGTNITDVGLTQLAEKCHNLKFLHFPSREKITDLTLITLSKFCPNLEDIRFPFNSITEIGIQALATSCIQLQRIDLTINITDAGLIAVATSCKKLWDITIFSTEVTDLGLITLAENCRLLEMVSVIAPKVTDDAIEYLVRKSPNLQSLKLRLPNAREKLQKILDKDFPHINVFSI